MKTQTDKFLIQNEYFMQSLMIPTKISNFEPKLELKIAKKW